MKNIKATIYYKITENHPDRDCIKGWKPGDVLTFSDVYRFDEIDDSTIAIIKRDLMLVAGGGYNADNIYDVSFKIA